jgi:hypothetical protein
MHRYNAKGSPERPIGVTLIEGKTAEEIFGRTVESQALPDLHKLEKIDPAEARQEPLKSSH